MNEELLLVLTRIANSLESIEKELIKFPDNVQTQSREDIDLLDAWFRENLLI